MSIRVEFFGMARQRAGAIELTLEPQASGIRLADLLKQIAEQAPRLGQTLLIGGQLHESLMVNVDGLRFIRDPETLIHDGQSVLILSADAGG
jgi:molybdopterin converting factor small subunit